VRVFLSERGASDVERRSVERAAAREALVLSRFRHPGAVRLKSYLPSGHPAGPTILFDYHPETLRLDDFLVQHGERLDLRGRLALVRQLAETVRSAHSRRVHHRTLSAHAVHIIPRDRGPRGRELGEEERWLSPWPQIADWQIATGHNASSGRPLTLAPTNVSGFHVSEQADPFLAPELRIPKADPVRLDVYGLGALTYLLVTGQAPGASQSEVMARLESGESLRPSALVDGLNPDIDELVEASTAYEPGRRLSTVDDFLEMLEYVEQAFTEKDSTGGDVTAGGGGGPTSETDEDPGEPEKDPLEAVAGDVLAGRWEVVRRLGTGSTSRAFLVRDLAGEPRRSGTLPVAVLKVALSEAKHAVLDREAEILGRIHRDSSIIALYEREPLTLTGRRVLALEYVGDSRELKEQDHGAGKGPRRREDTVARQLRDNGRLGMDQLEAYGKYLFGAVEHLEAEGIWHRDLKPDNIAIRIRPNGTRQLVLIDFSLAGYPAKEIDAGTEGYLDPFLGIITRGSYDGHAERYALAVTLHEMASNELPRWGDGGVTARQTDPKEWPYPQLAADAFEPAVRDGLMAFFRKALARDVKDRFSDLKPMERAWQRLFLDAQRTTAPSSGHGTAETVATTQEAGPQIGREDDDTSADQVRDQQSARADRTTPLSVSGLTLSAQSQLFAMGLNTVGDVLEYSARKFLTAPGMGSRTREEIQRRQKEWNLRLGKAAPAPLSAEARKAAGQEITELERAVAESVAVVGGDFTDPQLLNALSLDALAARLVPRPSAGNARSNAKEREAVRLLLQLPDETGKLPEGLAWVRQRDVAAAVGLTAGRIPQIVRKARERWFEDPALGLLREQVVDLLAERGRVAPVIEVADALIARRGTQHVERRDRRALALSLMRALVERESYDNESPQLFRYFHARIPKGADPVLGLLALDVREGVDGPDTPTLPALQDYALNLGARADRLAALESLPTASTVLTELDSVRRPPGSLSWDERRTAEIAVAASTRAALTPRLEIYPQDLDLVRALRITQAGVVAVQLGVEEERQPGLTVEALHKRVTTRFPDLGADPLSPRELPTGSALVRHLKQAGFELKLATRYDKVLRLIPDRPFGDATTGLTSASWGTSAARRSAPSQYDADAAIAAAVKADQRLVHSACQDGFRVLTVPQRRAENAVRLLTGEPYGARPVSLTGLFVDELRGVVGEAARPTWETILKADAAEPGSRAHQQLRIRTDRAWGRLEPRLRRCLAEGQGPLLLTDTAVLARYDALDLLGRIAEEARQGGNPLWLLVAQSDPARAPRLAGQSVPYQAGFNEWIVVPDAWVLRRHLAPDA